MKSASVIMPTFNKAPYLDLTLASYLGQSLPRFEIVIVDDGGTDGTRAAVDKYRRDLEIRHRRQAHAGRAVARNAGLDAASGELVIFSDDDHVVGPTFVAEHLAAHDPAGGPRFVLGWTHGMLSIVHPDLVGPLYPVLWRKLGRRDEPPPPLFALVHAEDVRSRFADVVAELGTVDLDWERKAGPTVVAFGDDLDGLEVAWFLGNTGNMSVPKPLVVRAGRFDPAYTRYGMEDTDLCYRLARAGARGIVSRRAVSYHQLHPRSNVAEDMRATIRHFSRKYRSLQARLFAPWFCGAIDLRSVNEMVRDARRSPARGHTARAHRVARLEQQVSRLIDR